MLGNNLLVVHFVIMQKRETNIVRVDRMHDLQFHVLPIKLSPRTYLRETTVV